MTSIKGLSLSLSVPLLAAVTLAFLFMMGPGRVAAQEKKPPEKQPQPPQLHYSIYLGDPDTLGQTNSNFARLDVLRSGKVYYHFASAPFTNSGGKVVSKQWQIPEKDAVALLDALEAEVRQLKTDAKKNPGSHHLKLGERLNDRDEKLDREVHVAALPAPIATRILPLLQEAHPELWKQKQPPSSWKVLP